MKQCRREKRSFLHTLILGNKKQTSPKKYRTLISLILLGHMQKISHFWAKMKKDPKCQLGRFCPEPFNCGPCFRFWRDSLFSIMSYLYRQKKYSVIKFIFVNFFFFIYSTCTHILQHTLFSKVSRSSQHLSFGQTPSHTVAWAF